MTLDPAADAVRSLTDAARQTRLRGGIQEPADFAGTAAAVLASVAANVGGVEELLAGRPGSWEANLIRQLVTGTTPPGRDAAEQVPDGPHGQHWAELLAADRYDPETLRTDPNVITTMPGVYAWFRHGEPIYTGRAASKGGLRHRLGQHLGVHLDLSHSTFRAWVAVQELDLPRTTVRARPPQLTAAQVETVNDWVDGCEVGWVQQATVAAAKRFEHGLLYAWPPPLNDD